MRALSVVCVLGCALGWVVGCSGANSEGPPTPAATGAGGNGGGVGGQAEDGAGGSALVCGDEIPTCGGTPDTWCGVRKNNCGQDIQCECDEGMSCLHSDRCCSSATKRVETADAALAECAKYDGYPHPFYCGELPDQDPMFDYKQTGLVPWLDDKGVPIVTTPWKVEMFPSYCIRGRYDATISLMNLWCCDSGGVL